MPFRNNPAVAARGTVHANVVMSYKHDRIPRSLAYLENYCSLDKQDALSSVQISLKHAPRIYSVVGLKDVR